MSTRCSIGLKRADGTETRIYCHYDGYIQIAGAYLQLAYNTADKVEALLSLGDLSRLGTHLEPKCDCDRMACVAYHRDMGDEFSQSKGLQEFNYTFLADRNVWVVDIERNAADGEGSDAIFINNIYSYDRYILLDKIIEAKCAVYLDHVVLDPEEVKILCTAKAKQARAKEIADAEEIEAAYDELYS